MAGDRYNDPDFIGWLKVNLSLIFAKEGLEQFSDDEVTTLHDNIKRNIPGSSALGPHTCIDNAKSRLFNKRKLTREWDAGTFSCQADHCDKWLGGIKSWSRYPSQAVEWDNSDLAWLSTDPWACAKLYMPYGCETHKCAKDADIAALLTLYIRCSHFGGFFTNVDDDCKKIKEIRNSMMHSSELKAGTSTVTTSTQVIIQFLEDLQNHQQPQHQQATKDAVLKIKELLSGKTEIFLNREYELRVLNNKLGSLINEVDALSKAIPDLSSMTLNTRADVSSNTGELKTLTAELDKVKSKSEDFSQFLTDYKIKGVSPEKLSEVRDKIARLETQIQTQMKELTDRIETLEKHLKDLNQEQGGIIKEQEELKQETGELKQEQGEMKKTLEEVSEGQRQCDKEQEVVKKKQEEMSKEQVEMKQEQGKLKQEHGEFKKKQEGLKQEQMEVNKKQEKLEKEQTEIKQEQRYMKQKQGDMKQEQRDMKQEQRDMKQETGELKQEQGKMKRTLVEVSEEQRQSDKKHEVVKKKQEEMSKEQGEIKLQQGELKQEQGKMKETLEEVSEGQRRSDKEQEVMKKKQEEMGKEQVEMKQEQGEVKKKQEEMGKKQTKIRQEQRDLKQDQGALKKKQKGLTQEQRKMKMTLEEVSEEQRQSDKKQEVVKKKQEEMSKEQVVIKQEQVEIKKEHEELKKDQEELKSVLVEHEEATSYQRYKMEGHMEKLPRNKRKPTLLNKWKKRFFKVEGGLLHYYKKSSKGRPSNSLQLMGGRVEEMGQMVIGIHDGSGSCLMVRVANEREHSQWIAALKSQTYQIKNNQVIREISVEDIQRRLISLYSKHAQKIPIYPLRPEWRIHVASLFVLPSMKVTNPRGISKHHLMMGTDEGSDIKVTSLQDIFPPAGSSCTDIYIMGDAGTGKSTLCEYLVHLWVNCHISSNQAPDLEEKFMERFEFLFYISLREATSCNVEEMIQSQLKLKDLNVSRLLHDHTSLIILDGLDEYSLKQTSRNRFGSENVPYRDHSDKCTVLTTSRPWKLELLRIELEPTIDKQITIVGLDTESQKKLVGKVADLLKSEEEHDRNPADFITEMQTQKLDKVMETPVLLMQMLGIWFSGEPLEGSKCSIYAKLIDKQIQFAEEVRKAGPNMKEVQGNDETAPELFSTYFKNYTYIMNNKSLLQKVCRFAYHSLSSNDRENSLVFNHEHMELFDMSRGEILLCLHLGLLTQYKVLRKITQRLKSLSFIHKTNQEFFAAIYLSQVNQADELKQLLERDFTSLSDILEMGMVYMFVCGINPTVACDISRFMMDKASGDARLEQYRQHGYDWSVTDPNTALVLQLQGLILAGIEEGRHNGHKITSMQLQDLYMSVNEQDCPPARILACTGSLALSHVKSLYIRDQGTISRDVLQQILQETSKSLHTLVLWDTVVSVEMIQALVQQNKGRLQTLALMSVTIDSVDISHLNQTELQAILSAPTISLLLHGVVLTHSQLEFLCQHVSSSSYGELYLVDLQCTNHGYRGTECKQRLDLSASRNLSRLVLQQLPVNEVRFVPDNLMRCRIGYLPEPVATSCISCLQRAEKLERLRCGGLRGSTVVELCTTMPHLVHLQIILLGYINLSGQQQVVRAVAQLKKLEVIVLYSVTMREEDLRELLAALPSSHGVTVELGNSSEGFPVTITDCNRHTHLLEHIQHNPHTHVYRDEVEIEGETCNVKDFWFHIESGCSWVTADTAGQ